jgi:undecaprenyl-diphosphatase
MTDATLQAKEQVHWFKRYFRTDSPTGLRRTLLYFAALLCLVLFGVLLETVKHTQKGALFDATVQSHIFALRSSGLTLFFKHVSELASVGGIVLFYVLACACLYKTRHGKLVPILILFLVLDGVIVEVVKKLVARHRPSDLTMLVHESSFSFPSGHTMAATLCWGIVAYFIARSCTSRLTRLLTVVIYALAVLLLALSRVYLGAHYPTDVIGSMLLGAGVLTIVITWLADHPKNLPREVFSTTVIKSFALAFGVLLIATLAVPSLFT